VVVIDELGRAVAPGAVRADRHRFGGDRQRTVPPSKSRGLLAGLIDGTVTAGIGLGGQVMLNDGVADGEAGSCWARAWATCC